MLRLALGSACAASLIVALVLRMETDTSHMVRDGRHFVGNKKAGDWTEVSVEEAKWVERKNAIIGVLLAIMLMSLFGFAIVHALSKPNSDASPRQSI